MWFFKKQKNIVGIALGVDSIKFSVVSNQDNSCNLRCYRDYLLEQTEVYDGLIFNTTLVHETIKKFIRDHKLKHITAVISLSHPLITEIITPTVTPAIQDQLEFYTWRSYQIQVSGQNCAYIAALRHELFFQLQLLFTSSDIKVCTLTTENMVLYNLFHRFANPLQTQEHVVFDIADFNNYMQEQVAANAFLKNIMGRTSRRFPAVDTPALMQALGLYILGTLNETI